jgi:hypothetical protein
MHGRTLSVILGTAVLSCSDGGVRPQRDPDAGSPHCGDARIDPGEQCDGANLGGNSCTGLGFDLGTVSCDAQCRLVTSACVKLCGNGELDPGEECDGTTGPLTCAEWGYLACTPGCRLDRLHCRSTRFRVGTPVMQAHGGPAIVTDLLPAGYAELVIPDPELTQLQIYRYEIARGFIQASKISRLDGVAPRVPFAADLDGDGRMDLAAINWDGSGDRYRYVPAGEALPDGGITAVPHYALQHLPASSSMFSWLGVARPGAGASADLAALSQDAVLIHRGGPVPSPAELLVQPGIVSGALGDFDGDGTVDLLLAGADARLYVRRGPEFTSEAALVLPAAALRIAAGDLDGDGDADVVIGTHDAVRIFENTGAGLSERRPNISTVAASDLAVRDLDLDGRPDVISLIDGQVEILRNLGSFTFDRYVERTGSGMPLSLALGDFEGDGDLDVAATLVNAPGGAATTTHVLENQVR